MSTEYGAEDRVNLAQIHRRLQSGAVDGVEPLSKERLSQLRRDDPNFPPVVQDDGTRQGKYYRWGSAVDYLRNRDVKPGPRPSGGIAQYVCGCPTPRKIRMSRRTADAGPITCGVCKKRFSEVHAEDGEGGRAAARPIAAQVEPAPKA